MTDPAIAILPYGRSLSRAAGAIPLDDLVWPLGRPDRLGQGRLADLAPTDHLVVYPRTGLHLWPDWGTRAQVSLFLGEPAVIHARHHALLRLSHRRFFRVLTFDRGLLARLPNAVLFPLGSTWVPDWQTIDTTKTDLCSLIASSKRGTEGQIMRHRIVDWARATGQEVEVMGGGYRPFAAKSDGLARFRFSVVIENAMEENYFSEKLVDAVLCGTVPIYWGCPNLGDFFDTAGIIQCRDEAALRAAIAGASVAEYDRRLPALRAMRDAVAAYAPLERRMAEAIRAVL